MAEKLPRTTVEQWAVLAAVVDEAGFSPAADRLGRSQSAVSYSIQQLEAQLPVALLDHRGRRAQLTDAGATLLRRARSVVEELRTPEALAASLPAVAVRGPRAIQPAVPRYPPRAGRIRPVGNDRGAAAARRRTRRRRAGA